MGNTPSSWPILVAVALLLVLSALLSAAKTALVASSRAKLKTLADRGVRQAAIAQKLAEERESLIGAILIWNLTVTVLATLLMARFLSGNLALVALTVIPLLLIVGEVVPRTIATRSPERTATRLAPALHLLILTTTPLVTLAKLVGRGFLYLTGQKPDAKAEIFALREEIADAIAQGHSEGAVEKEDRDRLLGALDLGQRTVQEIMKHRRQIEMIDADQSPDQIITQVLGSPHTRLPVFRDSDDNILGVVHAKDLLREVDRLVRGDEGSVAGVQALDIVKVAMKPYFIPDTTPLDEQMREFLKRRTHFALVVDEYGALQGLITLEDILEEIVGDITDEFDVVRKDAGLTLTPEGAYLIDGAMTIRDLNRATDWRLPDDEANTVAGLVIHEAQMIPNEGQVFSFHGFRFEVLARQENRITRLKLRML